MTLALQRLDNPLRPAYEGVAAVGWTISAICMLCIVLFTSLPRSALALMGMVSIVMASLRWTQALKRWNYKIDLIGKFSHIKRVELVRLTCPAGRTMAQVRFNWSRLHGNVPSRCVSTLKRM